MKFKEKHTLTEWEIKWDCTEYGIENPKSNYKSDTANDVGNGLPQKISWYKLFNNLIATTHEEDGWIRCFANNGKELNI